MRAICRTGASSVELRDIRVPAATPNHVVIKTTACGINAGDKAWLAGLFPEIPASLRDVCGACASGVVIATGKGVPSRYLGRKIAVYRSLKASSDCLGVWSEFARIHYLNTALLPEDVDEADYSASLVNAVSAHVFLDQVVRAGHRAVVCTAGTSATGRSLLGACHARNIPIISIVRTEAGKALLSRFAAVHVLATADGEFDPKLQELCAELGATAVFDGVGGALAGRVAMAMPPGSTIYCYGFLAGGEPLAFHSSLLLMRSLTFISFSVLRPLVRDKETLNRLLAGVEEIIAMPQFRTVTGRTFGFETVAEALAWQSPDCGRAVLKP